MLHVGVALVGDDRLGVVVQLLLAVLHVLVHVRERVRVERELREDLLVALEHLDRVPADLRLRDELLDRLLDVRERVLDAAREDVRRLAGLVCARRLDRGVGRLADALALERGDLDDLAAELLRELAQVDPVAVLADDVDHVHRHDDRDAERHQLGGEVEVALDVRAIDDVEDRVRLLLHEVFARDDLLQRIRRERVDAGQVLDDDVPVALQAAVLLLDRHAWPVADVLVRAGERIEQRRLAAVRVPRERDGDRAPAPGGVRRRGGRGGFVLFGHGWFLCFEMVLGASLVSRLTSSCRLVVSSSFDRVGRASPRARAAVGRPSSTIDIVEIARRFRRCRCRPVAARARSRGR